MATIQDRTNGEGHVRRVGGLGHVETRALPTSMKAGDAGPKNLSTGEALAAVARDAIDVASELVRDGVALGRLEAQRAISEFLPRVVWGGVTLVCGAVGAVLAVIAIMIGLGAVIPSVAWRLAILAAALFVVTFFGAVRVMRPRDGVGVTSRRVAEKEPETTERHAREGEPGATFGTSARSILPPSHE